MKDNKKAVRPLARVVARELSEQEKAQVAGGDFGRTGTGADSSNPRDKDVLN
jgi:hypothetical protein